jgi:hypothetical protein
MRRGSIAALGCAAAAAAVAVSAAGAGADGGSTAAKVASAQPAASAAEAERAPAKVALVVAERGSGRFQLRAPRRVTAGLVEISLRVPAGRATHDAQLIRVEGGHTVREVLAILGDEDARIPKWATLAGGVGQTDGRAIGRTVMRLQPGRYVIADTDEPEGDGVPSYAESGAIATMVVTGRPTAAKLPRVRATVTTREYAFAARRLSAGRIRVAFRNAGRQPHHMLAFPYNRGATLAQVKAFFTGEGAPAGPPPVDFAGATRTPALEGDTQVLTLALRRGKYALVCFLTDRAGGPPHAFKGMISEAVVR